MIAARPYRSAPGRRSARPDSSRGNSPPRSLARSWRSSRRAITSAAQIVERFLSGSSDAGRDASRGVDHPPARPSSSSPTSSTPPPSPSAWATPRSARRRARSTTRCAPPSASTAAPPIEGKTLGDGVLATFPAASQAIDAQRCRSSARPTRRSLPLHVGIHAGDVIREADNVFGGAVNIAARISAPRRAGRDAGVATPSRARAHVGRRHVRGSRRARAQGHRRSACGCSRCGRMAADGEPQIQYAQTSDGVSIAYCAMGDGPPLVVSRLPCWQHAQLDWQMPVELAARSSSFPAATALVRLMREVSALSQRDVEDFSLEARRARPRGGRRPAAA